MSKALKEYRSKTGKTQVELCEVLSISQGNLSRWERGIVPIPAEKVRGISKLTGIPLYKLREDIYPAPASVS